MVDAIFSGLKVAPRHCPILVALLQTCICDHMKITASDHENELIMKRMKVIIPYNKNKQNKIDLKILAFLAQKTEILAKK